MKTERAHRLIAGLGGERGRWEELSRDLSQRASRFIGDVFLAAAAIAYLQRFDAAFRDVRLALHPPSLSAQRHTDRAAEDGGEAAVGNGG